MRIDMIAVFSLGSDVLVQQWPTSASADLDYHVTDFAK